MLTKNRPTFVKAVDDCLYPSSHKVHPVYTITGIQNVYSKLRDLQSEGHDTVLIINNTDDWSEQMLKILRLDSPLIITDHQLSSKM